MASATAPRVVRASSPERVSVLQRAAHRALGGGLSGAAAMGLQVCSLMWMRTTMNYQYRHGTTTGVALRTLYADGGVMRFYYGVGPALVQGPLCRFGDTAANAGALAVLEDKQWPTPVKTAFGSIASASMRVALVPIDMVKTVMQVEGKGGIPTLKAKYRAAGLPVFFHGSGATLAANFAGHYPYFTVFNTLRANAPHYDTRAKQLLRDAGIGFCSSFTSDVVSNSLRVVKTCRQASAETVSYAEIVQRVVKTDGVAGLMGRGLKTRILCNGMQGMMFSVLYRLFEEQYFKKV